MPHQNGPPRIPVPPGTMPARTFKRESRRTDLLSVGIACLFMLALAVVFQTTVGHDSKDDPLSSATLLWLVIIASAVLVLALGLSSRDLVITREGIQLPRTGPGNMFRGGGIRKYSDIRNVDIVKIGSSRNSRISVRFDDGFSGSLMSRDLVDAGLSKGQRVRLLEFISGLGAGNGRKGAIAFFEEE